MRSTYEKLKNYSSYVLGGLKKVGGAVKKLGGSAKQVLESAYSKLEYAWDRLTAPASTHASASAYAIGSVFSNLAGLMLIPAGIATANPALVAAGVSALFGGYAMYKKVEYW